MTTPSEPGSSLPPGLSQRLDALLTETDRELAARTFANGPQPVHTVYVPADALEPTFVADWGSAALATLHEHAPTAARLGVADDVYSRVVTKLQTDPVEDVRVDFEDGYGARSDAEEDRHARSAGQTLRTFSGLGTGLRIKSLEATTRARAMRTLDVLLTALGRVPDGFVVTLPKASTAAQVRAVAELCEQLGSAVGGAPLGYELQIETPLAIHRLDQLVAATDERCAGLHYGTYDYSAALGVAAAYQALDHPVADHAKALMQVAAAARGLRVVDGSSNLLPVGDADSVHAAWAEHRRLVERSMCQGIYQSWDMHPAQLVSRYAAAFSFYRNGFPSAAARLRDYHGRVAGGVLDEPATERALSGYLRRGLDCGALDLEEVRAATGEEAFAALAR